MSLTIMGVHRQLCFQMILGSYGASVSPGGGFSASVEGSLLIGDSAVVRQMQCRCLHVYPPPPPTYLTSSLSRAVGGSGVVKRNIIKQRKLHTVMKYTS